LCDPGRDRTIDLDAALGGVAVAEITIAGIGPPHVVLYFHGGVHVLGDAFQAADLASHADRRAGARASSIDYRPALQQPFSCRRLAGTTEGDSVPSIFIPRSLDLHAQGHLPIEKIATPRPISETNEAVRRAEPGDLMKPVVVMA
jgi:Zn-dependent alcohol dehydrogenase